MSKTRNAAWEEGNYAREAICLRSFARRRLLANLLPPFFLENLFVQSYNCIQRRSSSCVTVTRIPMQEILGEYSDPVGWIDFRMIFFFMHVISATCVVTSCTTSFVYAHGLHRVSRTRLSDADDLSRLFRIKQCPLRWKNWNIWKHHRDEPVLQSSSSSNRAINIIPPLLIHPHEYFINLIKKRGEKRVKKNFISLI